jgi:hypothetical protein
MKIVFSAILIFCFYSCQKNIDLIDNTTVKPVTNVLGNFLASTVIARSEGELVSAE